MQRDRGIRDPRKDAMLGVAADAVGAWLFFTIGVSPTAAWAAVRFGWAAVRASFSPGRTTMQMYALSIIAVITAAGLAGCAGQSQYDVQFFKAFSGAQRPTS